MRPVQWEVLALGAVESQMQGDEPVDVIWMEHDIPNEGILRGSPLRGDVARARIAYLRLGQGADSHLGAEQPGCAIGMGRDGRVRRDTPVLRGHILDEERCEAALDERQLPLHQCAILTATLAWNDLTDGKSRCSEPGGFRLQVIGSQREP